LPQNWTTRGRKIAAFEREIVPPPATVWGKTKNQEEGLSAEKPLGRDLGGRRFLEEGITKARGKEKKKGERDCS